LSAICTVSYPPFYHFPISHAYILRSIKCWSPLPCSLKSAYCAIVWVHTHTSKYHTHKATPSYWGVAEIVFLVAMQISLATFAHKWETFTSGKRKWIKKTSIKQGEKKQKGRKEYMRDINGKRGKQSVEEKRKGAK